MSGTVVAPNNGPTYPKRLFGTHWCGPGGAGPPVNALDSACMAHDAGCPISTRVFCGEMWEGLILSLQGTSVFPMSRNYAAHRAPGISGVVVNPDLDLRSIRPKN